MSDTHDRSCRKKFVYLECDTVPAARYNRLAMQQFDSSFDPRFVELRSGGRATYRDELAQLSRQENWSFADFKRMLKATAIVGEPVSGTPKTIDLRGISGVMERLAAKA